MRAATRITAAALGTAAGIAGLEHGIFEILQGNVPTPGLVIASMGPPCIPEEAWNGCEPAMTILPNFLTSGILTVLISLGRPGLVPGIHPAPLRGYCINPAFNRPAAGWRRFLPAHHRHHRRGGRDAHQSSAERNRGNLPATPPALWPWPLVILIAWLLVMFPLGYFFNDFLQGIMGYGMCLIITLLPLSIYTAYAQDARA